MNKNTNINFILFYQPDKHLDVGTLINSDSNMLNTISWDVDNLTLKEIWLKGMNLLKVTGEQLPLYGPYSKYNSFSNQISQEFYQGVLLNNNLNIPSGFTAKTYNFIISTFKDIQVIDIYKILYNRVQDHISRKNMFY